MTGYRELEEIVYSPEEPMPLSKDEEARLRKLVEEPTSFRHRAKKFALDWYGPTLGILSVIATLVTALYFFVKPDVTALNASVEGLHRDIGRIDDEIKSANARIDTVLSQSNNRIDTVLNQAMDKALGAVSRPSPTAPTLPKNHGGIPQDDASLRNGLNKIRAVLDLATASSTKLGHERILAVSTTLKDVSKSEPELSPVAWDTMASLLHYNSTQNTISPSISLVAA